MEWSPLGTLRCHQCDGGPCHVWLPRVCHHPQNENKRYCGTPTTEFRSFRIGLWWFGAPENRVFTIWVWGGTDFLGNGHSSVIYIYIIFFCYHAHRQKSHIPDVQVNTLTVLSIIRSMPLSHFGSAASARNPQKFPSSDPQKSTESSVGNPPGTSYAMWLSWKIQPIKRLSDRPTGNNLLSPMNIYGEYLSMNIYGEYLYDMKVSINRTLFFPNRLIFVDSHYSQSYYVWMLIFLQIPPIMPISL